MDANSKGKFGITYKAKHNSNVDATVEKLLKGTWMVDKEVLANCQNHPNIITCLAVEENDLAL
jgi:hypothetical protein